MGFDEAFRVLIGHEGGLSLNRNDRGNWTSGKVGVGELRGTKYGISAMSYPQEDIRNLTLDRAKAIYKRDFWNKVRGDELPYVVAFNLFDGAVNIGPSRAIKWMQEAAGVAADGILGPKSLAAFQRHPEALAARYNGVRLRFMAGLSTWPTFGKGWARRIADNLMAVETTAPAVTPVPAPREPEPLEVRVADLEARVAALEATG